MFFICRKRPRRIAFLVLLLSILLIFGVFDHIFEIDFYNNFHYPYDGDIETFVEKMKSNQEPDVKPINMYTFEFIINPQKKCSGIQNLRLVYLVKSAPENIDRRIAIRSTWGYEKRFSDVEIRTLFLLGERESVVQKSIVEESKKFSDIIQGNFSDTYFNNTYKTMMGIYWAKAHCSIAKFYMFVDDDYYVSTKNVLRFIRYPTNYPGYIKEPFANVGKLPKLNRKLKQDFELADDVRLYAGYVFVSAPHRHYTSRWYVSLNEYQYHMWPPYVTAGAFILSRSVIIDMYYSSFYTKHFRFDDIYIGLLAYKTKIEPYHCDEFYFYRKPYNRYAYNYTIASHGFYDPKELIHIWNEQRSLGHA